ncbi:uncharacterized protein LOC144178301 [Haemaphysalis longicornis]
MAAFVTCVLLAVAGASMVSCDPMKGGSSKLDAFEGICIFKNGAVAIYSNVERTDQKCVTANYGEVDYKDLATNFTWHYNGAGGSPETKCFYNKVDATSRNIFYISPCDHPQERETAELLFSDGKSCFVGKFPPNTGDQCLLWTTPDTKDSVSERCEQAFTDHCGRDKHAIYDKTCG